MNKTYSFLTIVGVIGLICVSIFGIKGMYSLNLGFLTPFIFKHQADEREKLLINKNYSQVFMFIFVIFINLYIISNFVEFGAFLLRNWLGFFVSSLFILLGLNGLRLLKNE
ncbi:MAG: hypothetical protein Q7J16_13145 [Candidatus Cloacimonadales bacterium]|nr:hypothetical protein [Candidatus Cloacimonadales bacterium]